MSTSISRWLHKNILQKKRVGSQTGKKTVTGAATPPPHTHTRKAGNWALVARAGPLPKPRPVTLPLVTLLKHSCAGWTTEIFQVSSECTRAIPSEHRWDFLARPKLFFLSTHQHSISTYRSFLKVHQYECLRHSVFSRVCSEFVNIY